MEENSGVSFNQAQVALARQWIGQDPDSQEKQMTLTLPNPTTEGVVVGKKTSRITETVPIPASVEEAREIVSRFEHGSDDIRGDEDVSDSVAQHKMLDDTRLQSELWLASEEEELNAYVSLFPCSSRGCVLIGALAGRYVSELLYIHSKVMIVDDQRVIVSFLATGDCAVD
jgi:phospholipase D1/2